jgi:hypothetical protein
MTNHMVAQNHIERLPTPTRLRITLFLALIVAPTHLIFDHRRKGATFEKWGHPAVPTGPTLTDYQER